MNQVCIDIPEGMQLDQEVFKKENRISWVPIEPQYPKTWEEIHNKILKGKICYYIDETSEIIKVPNMIDKSYYSKNYHLTKERANAFLHLQMLITARDCYNDGWIADWTDDTNKYIIYNSNNSITKNNFCSSACVLNFKTEEIRDIFFENFKEEIEIAKELI